VRAIDSAFSRPRRAECPHLDRFPSHRVGPDPDHPVVGHGV